MLRPPANHFEPCDRSDPGAHLIYGSYYRLKNGKDGMEDLLRSLTIPEQSGHPESIMDVEDALQSKLEISEEEATNLEETVDDQSKMIASLEARVEQLKEALKKANVEIPSES